MVDTSWLSLDNILQTMKGHWSLILLGIILVYLYQHYTRTFSYFKERGIKYMEPTIFVGNAWERITSRISVYDFYKKLYDHFEGLPYGGYFEGCQPKLLIRDPELIKTICIKDSNYFPNRNRENRPAHPCRKKDLLSLRGSEWKQARTIVSPSFTSGKLKAMENLVKQYAEEMAEVLRNTPEKDREIEMKEFTGKYTLQTIGACAFGLDCESLKDADSPFLKHAHGFFKGSKMSKILFLASFLFAPPLGKYIPISDSGTKATNYFSTILDHVRAERQDKDKRRIDFLQLLLSYEEKERIEKPNKPIVDDLFIHGQSALFIIAGFETTSTLLSFACHALAVYPDIQNRLRKDILKAYEENGNECSYDMINSIPYLEQVILETLRMYPPIPRLERECALSYTLPGTNIKLEPGDVVVVPTSGIMSDPKYYPNPWKYDPERFSLSEKSSRANELFLTFGLGPRNCIGLRFAMMTAKFYLCSLLKEFKLSPCTKTQFPITFDKSFMFLKAEKGNWIKIEPLTPSKN